ncbi:hypothetical protein NDU88_001511 [Pleurodeles waltl]|uniref:Uncharacterized protein n=1 Tax=Pleurodeles waltl TaxID=8319 RepID=A0AAV7UT14_PLEWA|nr:hypothetical protein NDU88_001511 [Pleurodeles waltl]
MVTEAFVRPRKEVPTTPPRDLRPPSCLVARPGAPSLSPEGEVGVQRRGDPLAGGQQARRWALHRFGLFPLPPLPLDNFFHCCPGAERQ